MTVEEPSAAQAAIHRLIDDFHVAARAREMEWRRVGAASFLSDDEKRAALGYGRSLAHMRQIRRWINRAAGP